MSSDRWHMRSHKPRPVTDPARNRAPLGGPRVMTNITPAVWVRVACLTARRGERVVRVTRARRPGSVPAWPGHRVRANDPEDRHRARPRERHVPPRARCVHDGAVADVHPHMAGVVVVDDQVAGAHVLDGDVRQLPPLLLRGARDRPSRPPPRPARSGPSSRTIRGPRRPRRTACRSGPSRTPPPSCPARVALRLISLSAPEPSQAVCALYAASCSSFEQPRLLLLLQLRLQLLRRGDLLVDLLLGLGLA